MLLRASPLLRASHLPLSSGIHMALAAHLPFYPISQSSSSWRSSSHLAFVCQANDYDHILARKSFSLFVRSFNGLSGVYGKVRRPCGRIFCGQREYRKVRRRVPKSKNKELELNVGICIEEELPDDAEVLVSLSPCTFYTSLLFGSFFFPAILLHCMLILSFSQPLNVHDYHCMCQTCG